MPDDATMWLSVVIGLFLIIGGLSGQFVFRGTDQAWPLILAGLFVIGRGAWRQAQYPKAVVEQQERIREYEIRRAQATHYWVILYSTGTQPDKVAKVLKGIPGWSRSKAKEEVQHSFRRSILSTTNGSQAEALAAALREAGAVVELESQTAEERRAAWASGASAQDPVESPEAQESPAEEGPVVTCTKCWQTNSGRSTCKRCGSPLPLGESSNESQPPLSS